jgi:hypothetical protein
MDTFIYEGEIYKKVYHNKPIRTDETCGICVTYHGSLLCIQSGICNNYIIQKYIDLVELFKQL